MGDSYCLFKEGELWVRNLHISEYSHGNIYNHDPKRERKLLLQRRELRKLETKIKEKGFTIIPIETVQTEKGYIKLEIALAKGKKYYDKRDTIKDRDVKRDMERYED